MVSDQNAGVVMSNRWELPGRARASTVGGGFRCALALAVAAAFASGARAGDAPEPMNRVSFQVESSRDVANDRVHAVVGVTDEDVDPARLADRVNQTMTRALAKARAAAGVRVESGGYTTYPVHENGKLRRWRASQDLILESADVQAVTELIGALQSELQLRSVEFQVSPERRRAAEDELIAEALKLFQKRAEIIRTSLGARSYEVVQISISGDHGPPIRPMQMEARSVGAMVAPPALEGGSSRLSVFANGTIELD